MTVLRVRHWARRLAGGLQAARTGVLVVWWAGPVKRLELAAPPLTAQTLVPREDNARMPCPVSFLASGWCVQRRQRPWSVDASEGKHGLALGLAVGFAACCLQALPSGSPTALSTQTRSAFEQQSGMAEGRG